MTNNFKNIWEIYTASWKAEGSDERRTLFNQCLDESCRYNDPLVNIKGWDELDAYMMDFHKQISGGHFVTNYFLAHSNKSITRWEMKNSDGVILGDGISYGEYNDAGKLVSMTGFFESP